MEKENKELQELELQATKDFVSTNGRYSDLWQLAVKLSKSEDMIPATYNANPNKIFAALMYGEELNLSPMQSLQSVYVIKGHVDLYGDAILGVCMRTGEVEYIEEYEDDAGNYVCIIKRKGYKEVRNTFTVEMQKRNSKKNTAVWIEHRELMCKRRTRKPACKDAFADVFSGLYDFDVDEDFIAEIKNITPKKPSKNKFNNSVLENDTKEIENNSVETVDNSVIENRIQELFKGLKISAGKQIELKNKYPELRDLKIHLLQLKNQATEDKEEPAKKSKKTTKNADKISLDDAIKQFGVFISDNLLDKEIKLKQLCKYANCGNLSDIDPVAITSWIKFQKENIAVDKEIKKEKEKFDLNGDEPY